MKINRCSWRSQDLLYVAYRDTERGIPEINSKTLFKRLILDGAQTGLSWVTMMGWIPLRWLAIQTLNLKYS